MPSSFAATATAGAFTSMGFRARVLSEPGEGLVIVVGQFASRSDAAEAAEDAGDLRGVLQADGGPPMSLDVVDLARFAVPVVRTDRMVTGLMGEEPISVAAGGVTWRVLTGDAAELADAAEALRTQGFRALVLDGEPAQLVVGQFVKSRSAMAAASELPDLGEPPELVDLGQLSGER